MIPKSIRATGLVFVCMLFSLRLMATEQVLWAMYPAISPDGKWIAYAYQGNIFKVPATGGQAIALTSGTYYCSNPVWSHNSQSIAYASNEHGNFDVYIMHADGASKKRLTYYSMQDIPYDFSSDDQEVLFGAVRHEESGSIRFPIARNLPIEQNFFKLYRVSVNGGFNFLLSGVGMEHAHLQGGDRIIYQDNKGSIDSYYRKHQVSASTRDIWVYNISRNTYQKLSSYPGEDREPVWGEGDDFYFLSERKGTFNIFKSSVADTSRAVQLTFFDKYPVRSLSRSASGKLAFSYKGEIYTLTAGSNPKKLGIITTARSSVLPKNITSTPEELTVAPDGKQIAFTAHGDIFVADAEGKQVRQLTQTPYQEKMISFAPDGRSLAYAVEQGTSWNIGLLSLKDSQAGGLLYSGQELVAKILINSPADEFQPLFSPDGKKLAYVEDRDIIRVYDFNKGQSYTVLGEGVNFSSKDGDQYFKWSPDSKYLLVKSRLGSIGDDNEVLVITAERQAAPLNLSQSGFDDIMAHWTEDGKSVYWLSNKNGLMNFTRDASQYDILSMALDAGKLNSAISSPKSHEALGKLTQWTDRSAELNDVLIPASGKVLYFLAKYNQTFDLWAMDLETKSSRLFAKLGADDPKMQPGGKSIFIFDNGKVLRVDTADAKVSNLELSVKQQVFPDQERAYVLEHIYNRVRKRFVFPDLSGVDWNSYYQDYKRFLPHISNDYDFTVLANELLGELNNSHISANYYGQDIPNADQTAALGLLYDEKGSGEGLLVTEVIKNGPFDYPETQMSRHAVIKKINDSLITAGTDWPRLLNHLAGKNVKVEYVDAAGGRHQETVKAISGSAEQSELLYDRWVSRMEYLTDSLSGGKIGYVHVRSMDDASFRELYHRALGKYRNCKAMVIDTRFNIGGSLHNELLDFFSGSIFLTERRQGKETWGGESYHKWNRPSIVLVGEGNYSDAFLFPYLYQREGVGKLVGMPVPGTGTGTIGEDQLIADLFIAVPQGATYGKGEKLATENHQLEPDIPVNNTYLDMAKGIDLQLTTAIKELLNGPTP